SYGVELPAGLIFALFTIGLARHADAVEQELDRVGIHTGAMVYDFGLKAERRRTVHHDTHLWLRVRHERSERIGCIGTKRGERTVVRQNIDASICHYWRRPHVCLRSDKCVAGARRK